ncbi:MAG: hypothetical protein LIP09_16580 [Bacteroidales bacterium]|nr:hypothetical protein [Bacteroidales bacterium]
MNEEEMKKIWADLNWRLEESEKINRCAIRKMFNSKATSSYEKIRSMEQWGLWVLIICLIVFPIMYFTGKFQHWYSVATIEALGFIILGFSLRDLKCLPSLGDGSIIDVQKKIAQYQKNQTIGKVLCLAILVLMFVLFFFWEGRGFATDGFHMGIFFGILALGIPGCIYLYRHINNKISEINAYIQQLTEFAKDD